MNYENYMRNHDTLENLYNTGNIAENITTMQADMTLYGLPYLVYLHSYYFLEDLVKAVRMAFLAT